MPDKGWIAIIQRLMGEGTAKPTFAIKLKCKWIWYNSPLMKMEVNAKVNIKKSISVKEDGRCMIPAELKLDEWFKPVGTFSNCWFI